MTQSKYKRTIYIFDLDGTLVEINTTFECLKFLYVRRRLLYKILKFIGPMLKLLSKITFKLFRIDIYRNLSVFLFTTFIDNKLVEKINKIFVKRLNSNTKISCYKIFQKLKRENKKILILSATIDIIKPSIIKFFNCHVLTSELHKFKNRYIGVFKYDLLRTKEKVLRFLKTRGFLIESFYTDDPYEAIIAKKFARKVYLV